MQTPTEGPSPIYTLHLWGEPASECGICEEWGPHRHAVGWYCGPVQEDIGEPVPEWGPDAIAGGRSVCKACHDRFYGIEAGAPAVALQDGQKAMERESN
ncbi:hypothetical protein [Methylobacterium gnaphalii]|nr:hypothetical protein [Methylobacterium gnaphalii]